jgi:hypothetical protein
MITTGSRPFRFLYCSNFTILPIQNSHNSNDPGSRYHHLHPKYSIIMEGGILQMYDVTTASWRMKLESDRLCLLE